jgi:hypothetical protein
MPYQDTTISKNGAAREEAMQMRALQLSALSRVYEGADRILTGDPINVHVVEDGPAVTWSDGENIYINQKHIGEISLEMLTKVSGLNYHELAHHFYTPREGTTLLKYVIEQGYYTSFNILEDQRIESLLCARYPSVSPYLQSAALIWLQTTPEAAFTNYPLIAGRRHINVKIREAFRDLFYKPELIPDIQRITNEYRCLAFPRDYKRAEKLIKEFHELIISQMDIPPQCGLGSCDARSPIKKGRPEPGKAQERDARVASTMGKPESFYIPKEPLEQSQQGSQPNEQGCFPGEPHNSGPQKGESVEGEGTSNGSTPPTQTHTEVSMTQEEMLQKREEKLNKPTQLNTWGNSHVKSQGGLPKDLNTLLENDIQSIYDRKDVIKDVKRKQNIIVHGDENWDDKSTLGKFSDAPVPAKALLDYRRFANELRKLKDDSEPAWERETVAGKLNMPRVMRGCDIDKSFDSWSTGDDSTNIEAVILIDRSSSMSSGANDKKASVACWTVKRALESIDCSVTVYAFDDKNEIAYRKQDKAARTSYKFIHGQGGTDPYESLLLSEKTFMMSTRPNKMLFLITDGQFDSKQNNPIIERLAKRGVLTVMVLIMDEGSYNDAVARDKAAQSIRDKNDFSHGAELFARVNGGKDLLQLAKSVVVGAIKKRRLNN